MLDLDVLHQVACYLELCSVCRVEPGRLEFPTSQSRVVCQGYNGASRGFLCVTQQEKKN